MYDEYTELYQVIDKIVANTNKPPIILCPKEHIATMKENFPSLKIIEFPQSPQSCFQTDNIVYILPDHSDETCRVKYVLEEK